MIAIYDSGIGGDDGLLIGSDDECDCVCACIDFDDSEPQVAVFIPLPRLAGIEPRIAMFIDVDVPPPRLVGIEPNPGPRRLLYYRRRLVPKIPTSSCRW